MWVCMLKKQTNHGLFKHVKYFGGKKITLYYGNRDSTYLNKLIQHNEFRLLFAASYS